MGSGRSATASGNNISRYIREIRTYPMLSAEEERELCRRWRDRQNISAVLQLVGSHLHLIVKIARGCRGYGLPSEDLIGEGYVGLMRAVCRADEPAACAMARQEPVLQLATYPRRVEGIRGRRAEIRACQRDRDQLMVPEHEVAAGIEDAIAIVSSSQ